MQFPSCLRAFVPMCLLVLIASAHAQPARPNILYIMTDDHAAHAISAYGSKLNTTPNIDRLAREGMRFTNCFVTNALCGPSRAVLLSGKYNHVNGFMDNRGKTKFDFAQDTFIKTLKADGYQTAVVGKWHLNAEPVGFDYWAIMPGQGIYNNPVFMENGKRIVVPGYVTDIITDKTLDFIKKRDPAKPFAMLYHHKAPHREWNPEPKYKEAFKDKTFPLPETFNDDYANRASPAREQEMTVEKHLTPRDVKIAPPEGLSGQALKEWKYQRYMQDYLACVQSVDDNIGRALKFLDDNGLAENTIVVYTSDNGFFLGDHGWYDKRFMYEHSLRVPLIVRYPKGIKAGQVSDAIVSNVDFAPTFMDYAGVKPYANLHGRSLKPVLEGNTPADWRKSFYYHYYEYPDSHRVREHYGVRTATHKLIYFYTVKEWELFDLQKDPNELKSVYADPAYAKVKEELTTELKRLRTELKDETGANW